MKSGFRFSSIVAYLVLVLTCIGCDGVGTTVSDVPCLRPTAWPADVLTPLVRAAEEGTDVLLVTGQTNDQSSADDEDGMREFRPHSAVYRLDPEVGSFELVNDRVWDDADGEVVLISGAGSSGSLLGAVAVAGGNRLSDTISPTRPVAAVLSSAGFTPGVPFVRSGFGTGQHYHQLFSEIDGSPLPSGSAWAIPSSLGTGRRRKTT